MYSLLGDPLNIL